MAGSKLLFLVVLEGAFLSLPSLCHLSSSVNEEQCEWIVTWNFTETVSDKCSCKGYMLGWTGDDGGEEASCQRSSHTPWIALNKELHFNVSLMCHGDHGNVMANVSFLPKGIPDTEAVNITCVWDNKQLMLCSWGLGEKASPDTSYTLSYWYSGMEKAMPCMNYLRKGTAFQCSFNFSVDGYPNISVLVKGTSRDVRPVCKIVNTATIVKPRAPSNVNFSKVADSVNISWTNPLGLSAMTYEVEINGTRSTIEETQDNFISIPIPSGTRHTFRVRAFLGMEPGVNGLWSDWSREIVDGDPDYTLLILLLVLMPFCVAVLTILLLVYRKRIKLMIIPKVPDPERFLRKMFEEQSEGVQNQLTNNSLTETRKQSYMLIQSVENESQGIQMTACTANDF